MHFVKFIRGFRCRNVRYNAYSPSAILTFFRFCITISWLTISWLTVFWPWERVGFTCVTSFGLIFLSVVGLAQRSGPLFGLILLVMHLLVMHLLVMHLRPGGGCGHIRLIIHLRPGGRLAKRRHGRLAKRRHGRLVKRRHGRLVKRRPGGLVN